MLPCSLLFTIPVFQSNLFLPFNTTEVLNLASILPTEACAKMTDNIAVGTYECNIPDSKLLDATLPNLIVRVGETDYTLPSTGCAFELGVTHPAEAAAPSPPAPVPPDGEVPVSPTPIVVPNGTDGGNGTRGTNVTLTPPPPPGPDEPPAIQSVLLTVTFTLNQTSAISIQLPGAADGAPRAELPEGLVGTYVHQMTVAAPGGGTIEDAKEVFVAPSVARRLALTGGGARLPRALLFNGSDTGVAEGAATLAHADHGDGPLRPRLLFTPTARGEYGQLPELDVEKDIELADRAALIPLADAVPAVSPELLSRGELGPWVAAVLRGHVMLSALTFNAEGSGPAVPDRLLEQLGKAVADGSAPVVDLGAGMLGWETTASASADNIDMTTATAAGSAGGYLRAAVQNLEPELRRQLGADTSAVDENGTLNETSNTSSLSNAVAMALARRLMRRLNETGRCSVRAELRVMFGYVLGTCSEGAATRNITETRPPVAVHLTGSFGVTCGVLGEVAVEPPDNITDPWLTAAQREAAQAAWLANEKARLRAEPRAVLYARIVFGSPRPFGLGRVAMSPRAIAGMVSTYDVAPAASMAAHFPVASIEAELGPDRGPLARTTKALVALGYTLGDPSALNPTGVRSDPDVIGLGGLEVLAEASDVAAQHAAVIERQLTRNQTDYAPGLAFAASARLVSRAVLGVDAASWHHAALFLAYSAVAEDPWFPAGRPNATAYVPADAVAAVWDVFAKAQRAGSTPRVTPGALRAAAEASVESIMTAVRAGATRAGLLGALGSGESSDGSWGPSVSRLRALRAADEAALAAGAQDGEQDADTDRGEPSEGVIDGREDLTPAVRPDVYTTALSGHLHAMREAVFGYQPPSLGGYLRFFSATCLSAPRGAVETALQAACSARYGSGGVANATSLGTVNGTLAMVTSFSNEEVTIALSWRTTAATTVTVPSIALPAAPTWPLAMGLDEKGWLNATANITCCHSRGQTPGRRPFRGLQRQSPSPQRRAGT